MDVPSKALVTLLTSAVRHVETVVGGAVVSAMAAAPDAVPDYARNEPLARTCPLCANTDTSAMNLCFHSAKNMRRTYTECYTCGVVFVPPHYHMTNDDEKERYDQHKNDSADAGYRTFLSRTARPVLGLLARQCLAAAGAPVGAQEPIDSDAVIQAAESAMTSPAPPMPPARGLDFGCGPGPTLSLLLEASPLVQPPMALYDLYYYPDKAVLAATYDFVTATEVVEHMADVGPSLDMLWSLVRPGGALAVMTKRVTDPAAFAKWHYARDPTHITFFHKRSFEEYLTARWGAAVAAVHFHKDDVVLFVKATGAS